MPISIPTNTGSLVNCSKYPLMNVCCIKRGPAYLLPCSAHPIHCA